MKDPSVQHKLIRNTSFLIFSRVLADFLFFGFYIGLTRRFDQQGIGVYSFVIALSSFAFIAANYGMNPYMTREASRKTHEISFYLGRGLLIHSGLSLISLTLMIL